MSKIVIVTEHIRLQLNRYHMTDSTQTVHTVA
jgi:hypothetical protein